MESDGKGFNSPLLISKIKSMTEAIDFVLSDENGEKFSFALIVFSDNQAMMTGNSDRESTIEAIQHLIEAHNSGEPMLISTMDEMAEMVEANEKIKH